MSKKDYYKTIQKVFIRTKIVFIVFYFLNI